MMRKSPSCFVDITGQQFNNWTVLERIPNRYGKVYYRCRCICGLENEVGKQQLVKELSTGCGCHYRKNKRINNWGKRWTEEEDHWLKLLYPINGARDLIAFLGRSRIAIVDRANKMGLKTKRKIYPRKDQWSYGEIEQLRKHYPVGGALGCLPYIRFRSKNAMTNKARELGIFMEGRKQCPIDKSPRKVNKKKKSKTLTTKSNGQPMEKRYG